MNCPRCGSDQMVGLPSHPKYKRWILWWERIFSTGACFAGCKNCKARFRVEESVWSGLEKTAFGSEQETMVDQYRHVLNDDMKGPQAFIVLGGISIGMYLNLAIFKIPGSLAGAFVVLIPTFLSWIFGWWLFRKRQQDGKSPLKVVACVLLAWIFYVLVFFAAWFIHRLLTEPLTI